MRAAVSPLGSAWADCIQYTSGGLSSLLRDLPGVARAGLRGFACSNEVYEHPRGLGQPRFRLNLDTGALTDEKRPPAETIRELGAEAPSAIARAQVNDPNRLGPGMGALDFAPIRDALADAKYACSLSVEAFDFASGPERIATESLRNLRQVWAPRAAEPRHGAARMV